jgi:hypothetical protein
MPASAPADRLEGYISKFELRTSKFIGNVPGNPEAQLRLWGGMQ